jgi:low temperature requirement protein LtrA
MSSTATPPFARDRRHHAKVTNEELFFDLIYAFAITQLSHRLLDNLTPLGAVQTLVLWFAVWLGWQYTCWITNWFNPENLRKPRHPCHMYPQPLYSKGSRWHWQRRSA